jgi:hypothetical protein
MIIGSATRSLAARAHLWPLIVPDADQAQLRPPLTIDEARPVRSAMISRSSTRPGARSRSIRWCSIWPAPRRPRRRPARLGPIHLEWIDDPDIKPRSIRRERGQQLIGFVWLERSRFDQL